MLKINALDHINVNIKNFQETINFYQKHFGLEAKEEGVTEAGTPFKIIGLTGKIYMCLYELNYSIEKRSHINHIGFHIQSYDKAIQYIREHNIKVTSDSYQYPKSRSIYIEDPNGLEIELSENYAGSLL